MDRSDTYYGQLVSQADLDQLLDDAENADRATVADLGFVGVMTGLVASEHTPNNMTVDVTGGTAYDPDGARTVVPSTQTVNLAVDHAGVTTAVVTGGNSKVISICLKFTRALSQPETDSTGTTVYYRRDESFSFYVKQGAEAVSPTPPSLEADGILLCDVTIAHGATTIVDGDISIARRQDLVVLTGTPLGTSGTGGRYGTYLAALQAIVTRYNDHIDASGDVHPASDIDYDGSGTWANADAGDAINATSVEGAIDSIVSKLGATTSSHSGASLVGCAQMAGTYTTISGGTVYQILTALRSAANLEYTISGTWANGDAADRISAQALQGAISAIPSKLGATTASHSGLHLIGGATCGNFTAGTAYNFFLQLTQTTGGDDGAKRIGAEAEGSLSLGTVRSQLDELDTGWGKLGRVNTWTAAQTFDDITASGSTHYKLASRSVTRVQTAPWFGSFTIVGVLGGATAGAVWSKPLDLPHGAVLTAVSVSIDPGGHASLPAVMPSFIVVRQDFASNTQTTVATGTDASPDVATFNPAHAFSATGLSETIDRTAYHYYLEFTQESGANSNTGMLIAVKTTCTVTAIDDCY